VISFYLVGVKERERERVGDTFFLLDLMAFLRDTLGGFPHVFLRGISEGR
jgi:hypothetical protein